MSIEQFVAQMPAWGALPLRLMLGLIFIVHGFPKLKSPETTGSFFLKLGIPVPRFSAVVVGIVEFFGGIALILGFSTRIAAALLVIDMTVATLLKKTKMNQGFIGGYEFDLALLAALITIFLIGSGNLSIDQTFGWLLG